MDTPALIAVVKAQNVLLDLEIKMLQEHILRLDAMIDECAKLKEQLRIPIPQVTA
jgi:hypothetical protein